jgi:hypothetical protein
MFIALKTGHPKKSIDKNRQHLKISLTIRKKGYKKSFILALEELISW